MNDKKFNAILGHSSLQNFEVSSNAGNRRFFSSVPDNMANNIQTSPSLEELRKKFFGTKESSSQDRVEINLASESDDSDDVDMKIVSPKSPTPDSDTNSSGGKTVIASESEGIVGAQG